jgi:hypothetical protein
MAIVFWHTSNTPECVGGANCQSQQRDSGQLRLQLDLKLQPREPRDLARGFLWYHDIMDMDIYNTLANRWL